MSQPEEEERPPGLTEQAWEWARPLARRAQTASGWQVRLRTTRFPDFVGWCLLTLVLAPIALATWSLYQQPDTGMGLAFPMMWTLLVAATLLPAIALGRSTAHVHIDRHRLTLGKTAMSLNDITAIETVPHVYRWFEVKLQSRMAPIGERERRIYRRRFDVVVRCGDERQLLLPLDVASQAAAQSVVELLRRTIDEARVPTGYRDPGFDAPSA